jgi:hypothetical protein
VGVCKASIATQASHSAVVEGLAWLASSRAAFVVLYIVAEMDEQNVRMRVAAAATTAGAVLRGPFAVWAFGAVLSFECERFPWSAHAYAYAYAR